MSPSLTTPSYAVSILKINEERTLATNGQSMTSVVVTFNVGSHGPFQERFEKASFDPTAVNAALRAFATKLGNVGQ